MKKTSVFVEFNIQDFERIRDLPNFLDAWQYPVPERDHIHRREFGWIETENTLIRFLAHDPRLYSKILFEEIKDAGT
jgi:hypothetical protein